MCACMRVCVRAWVRAWVCICNALKILLFRSAFATSTPIACCTMRATYTLVCHACCWEVVGVLRESGGGDGDLVSWEDD